MKNGSANISGTERGKAGCALLALSLLAASAGHAEPPNVVLIYADDLGFGDLSCYSGEGRIETPHCDRLAEEGCRFTNAYAAASVCTPARYGLLTGRYPWRTWLKKGVVGNTPALIDPGRFTMADLFREAGYRTAAIGKWHLGFGDRGQKDLNWNAEIPGGPCDLGFEEFFGMPVSHFYPPFVYIENRRVFGLDPADPLSLEFPEKRGPPRQVGGRAATYDPEEAGRELVERACRYVKQNSDAPFFLYYAAIEPHTPFTPHPDYRGSSDAGLYGDFVVQFDDGVGRLLRTLDEEGLADDTIVILTSDNGGISPRNGHFEKHDIDYDPNGPLRGDKADALGGGLRIPFLVRWPGVVKPGTVSSEVICQTDLMVAFADLLDRPLPAGAAEDSRNVLAALKGGPAPDEPNHDGSHPDRPWQGWTREAAKTNPRALAKQRDGAPPLASPIRPLAGLYDSRDRGVADWHVALAEAAGIDAFLVDWWGEHLGRDENAEAGIIAACEASGFP